VPEGIRKKAAGRNIRTKWEEVVGDWRRLHNVELHNLYFSPDICSDQNKEVVMEEACSMNRGGENCIQDFGVAIILKCVLLKCNGNIQTGLIWLKIGTSGSLFRTRQ
jgi:hypothetical protein